MIHTLPSSSSRHLSSSSPLPIFLLRRISLHSLLIFIILLLFPTTTIGHAEITLLSTMKILTPTILSIRGGGGGGEREDRNSEGRSRRSSSSSSGRRSGGKIQNDGRRTNRRHGGYNDNNNDDYDDEGYDEEYNDGNNRHRNDHHHRRSKRHPPPSATLTSTATNLAKKSFDLTSRAAFTTLGATYRATKYLATPRSVSKKDCYGVWRLDQVLGGVDNDSRSNSRSRNYHRDPIGCVANVELTAFSEAVVRYAEDNNDNDNDENNEETLITPYLFTNRKWPRTSTIEFRAFAFQGPHDKRPKEYIYVGGFVRKMADRSVVKIVGVMYEVKKSKFKMGGIMERFGGGTGAGTGARGREVGSFVARRRMTTSKSSLSHQNGGGNRHNDEYDDEYDENDDSGDDLYDGEGYDDVDNDYSDYDQYNDRYDDNDEDDNVYDDEMYDE